MINSNQNILFTGIILALCVISFVHVFLFPLYDINASTLGRRNVSKSFYDLEQSLCTHHLKRKLIWRQSKCPKDGVITVKQGGQLGNQMWEYATVWALARRIGLEPYVPRCIKHNLEKIFDQLSVPSFEEIAHCPVNLKDFVRSLKEWNCTNQSIVLPQYTIKPALVLSWVQDIIQEFTFKSYLIHRSQLILSIAKKNLHKPVYVGVHVRRGDYIGYLWRRHAVLPAKSTFYLNAMKYFEDKYNNTLFIIVSDDPVWCKKMFHSKKNVYMVSNRVPNPPELDLAILSACNHSIFDYGTFGIWGAILARGETVFYNLSTHSSFRVGHLLDNWHALV